MKALEARRIMEEAVLKRKHTFIVQGILAAAKNGESKTSFMDIPVDVIEVLRNDGYEVVKNNSMFYVHW